MLHMISPGRGQYQMPNQNWFKHAPISKAWVCSLLSCSAACIYWHNFVGNVSQPSLKDVLQCTGIGRFLLSKVAFNNPSLVIAGTVLLYNSRWIERRFGSKKFLNFIVINSLFSAFVEVLLLYSISRLFDYDSSTIHFAAGPFSILAALYVTFTMEFPVVPYAQIFGMSFSVHNLPFLMFIQLFAGSRASAVACFAGAISALVWCSRFDFLRRINVLPDFVCRIFSSPTNPVGWLATKFAILGEANKMGKILPVAATVERQRIEVIDDYERRLMLSQMQQMHSQQITNSSGSQLHFLSRLFGERTRPPTEDQIRQLMDMGFGNRQMVIQALQESGNDASAAAHTLLYGSQ